MVQAKTEKKRPLILIVEDHLETRTFLEMLLGEDYEIDTAESASEALRRVQQRAFDLFLIDIALRDSIDGTALVGMLRTQEEHKITPMIAMTAHQLQEDRQYYLDHGFDDYVGKPFYPQDLLDLIADLLNQRSPIEGGADSSPQA